MRKHVFLHMREQRGDQLRGNRAADQRLCFRYTDSIIHLVSITLAIFCVCTAWFEGAHWPIG